MTTADDTFALLAAANPVPELPAVEPPERLRRLVETEGHTVGGTRRRTPAGRLMRPLAASLAALAAAAIGLVGRERRGGRLLWKLEGDVAFAFHSFHAKPVPIMAVVVLVDPRTYLPVVQRTVSLLPGRRREVQGESELLSYRRLPGGAASEALLKLSAQHPHARVVTENPMTHVLPRSHSHYIRERLP